MIVNKNYLTEIFLFVFWFIGHQLLQKMGWSGQTGLGRLEQGIVNPIEGGQVRDRDELFLGVGMQSTRSDPFEQFRKNKSQGYIQRLRTRDEQRECIFNPFFPLNFFNIFFVMHLRVDK